MSVSVIINRFLQTQAQIKIYHWQTKSYAEHKALDECYAQLGDLIDEFVEVLLGKNRNMSIKDNPTITINDYVDNSDVTVFLDNLDKFLIGIKLNPENKNTDLYNIRDEMMGVINKTKYLLTLK